jgi:glutamine---fructose-6-phosphate transaminase (isomerizing)
MCGIFGLASSGRSALEPELVAGALRSLFRLSEARGKEAAGIAFRTMATLAHFRRPMRASRMIGTRDYRSFLAERFEELRSAAPPAFAAIGHARLVTNGRFGVATNNQPVNSGGCSVVHNGIIVNDQDLWRHFPEIERRTELDSEILSALLDHFLRQGEAVAKALRRTFELVSGEANVAALFQDRPLLALASNAGSLYLMSDAARGVVVFASEEPILRRLLAREHRLAVLLAGAPVEHVPAGRAALFDLAEGRLHRLRLQEGPLPGAEAPQAPAILVDEVAEAERRRRQLRRCRRCVLPETVPGSDFDAHGVCRACRTYQPFASKGIGALRALADKHRRKDGRPDCVIGLSGGRDSSYGLHLLRMELGLNPIAYTYDWALVTDLARRNQSRLCARLGIEHVLVSADIARKRRHIRSNVTAWTHRPDLGLVPLFMAGDKMYFYYYHKVARDYGVDLIFTCGNRFEMTDFKSAFSGARTNTGAAGYRPYDVSIGKKAAMIAYYLRQFALNPRYLNRSLLDTALAFYAAYVMPHDMIRIYDYVAWDEALIERTLREQYDWEQADDTESTWRIGDGTAAFYNHIYLTMAGFSEHDAFRSNQVRAGVLSRDEALVLLERDNRPRFDSLSEYARVIGFDLDQALSAIDMAPKLY